MRNMKRIVIWGVLSLILLIAGGCLNKEEAVNEKNEISENIEYVGNYYLPEEDAELMKSIQEETQRILADPAKSKALFDRLQKTHK